MQCNIGLLSSQIGKIDRQLVLKQVGEFDGFALLLVSVQTASNRLPDL